MSTESDTSPQARPEDAEQARQLLRRPRQGRMLAGVAAGVASYLGVEVTIVRIVMLALALLGIVGSSLAVVGVPLYLAGIPLYLACWLVIPEEGHEQSIAGHLLAAVRQRSG